MKHGWTGGQYSLVRGVFGYALALVFLRDGASAFERVAGVEAELLVPTAIGAALLLAVGKFERGAAIYLTGACAIAAASARGLGAWDALAVVALMFACVPSAPFGSWSAAGRVDPRGAWRMPTWVHAAAWIAMIAGYVYSAASRGPDLSRALDLGLAAACLLPVIRPWAWSTTIALSVVRAVIDADPSGTDVGLLCLHAFTFDPRWIPARGDAAQSDRVYYDGECGLCQRFVRFVIAEDVHGALRFAPLQGASFRAFIEPRAGAGVDLPDSVVVETGPSLLVRSNAVLHVLERLGGIWRALGVIARCVPWRVRDVAYDAIARTRKVFFRAPPSACPVLPADLAARFDP
ncbi:MAG: thiol-disulfide oxidoreductase DCC family protein [Planctomycetota bacterium]